MDNDAGVDQVTSWSFGRVRWFGYAESKPATICRLVSNFRDLLGGFCPFIRLVGGRKQWPASLRSQPTIITQPSPQDLSHALFVIITSFAGIDLCNMLCYFVAIVVRMDESLIVLKFHFFPFFVECLKLSFFDSSILWMYLKRAFAWKCHRVFVGSTLWDVEERGQGARICQSLATVVII